jgi:hypothetical protein
MSRCIQTRSGMRVERLNRLPSPPVIHRRGTGNTPSASYGSRWAALPVEGSKAWRDSQPGTLRRIFFTR